MDVLAGFRAFFADPQWKSKAGWGSALLLSSMCIPFLGQVVVHGWAAQSVRRAAITGEAAPAPARLEWNTEYLTRLLGPGFRILIAQFVWSLPLIVIGFPALLLAIFLGDDGPFEDFAGDASLPLQVVGFLVYFFAVAAAPLVSAGAVTVVSVTDKLESALNFALVFDVLRKTLGTVLGGFIVLMIVGWFATMIGLLACCVGIFPAQVVFFYGLGHLHLLVYRTYLAKGGAPLAAARPVDGAYADMNHVDPSVFA
jgi:hypothetical protein